MKKPILPGMKIEFERAKPNMAEYGIERITGKVIDVRDGEIRLEVKDPNGGVTRAGISRRQVTKVWRKPKSLSFGRRFWYCMNVGEVGLLVQDKPSYDSTTKKWEVYDAHSVTGRFKYFEKVIELAEVIK